MTEDPAPLYQQIGQDFVDAAPAGWRSGLVVYRRAGKTAEYVATAYMAADREAGLRVPRSTARAFKELRALTYQPGKGAWFTATATLLPGGKFSLDYDYDHEPEWLTPTAAGHYAEDAEQFPRDPQHTPNWLKERLAEAAR